MAGYCRVTLIGNLGRDPEVRYSQDGMAYTNFSLAATERVKGEEKTQWFRVTAFGKLGEVCGKYLSKGRQTYVEGRLSTSEWTDQEGNKRFSLEVIANNVVFLGSRNDEYQGGQADRGGSNSAPRPQPPPPVQSTPVQQQAPPETPAPMPSPPPVDDEQIPF